MVMRVPSKFLDSLTISKLITPKQPSAILIPIQVIAYRRVLIFFALVILYNDDFGIVAVLYRSVFGFYYYPDYYDIFKHIDGFPFISQHHIPSDPDLHTLHFFPL